MQDMRVVFGHLCELATFVLPRALTPGAQPHGFVFKVVALLGGRPVLQPRLGEGQERERKRAIKTTREREDARDAEIADLVD